MFYCNLRLHAVSFILIHNYDILIQCDNFVILHCAIIAHIYLPCFLLLKQRYIVTIARANGHKYL